jgi:electron transfer flavoprotein alpha subunit
VSTDVAAVLVHIDLDGAQPSRSSLVALAAGRQLASSWGATLYAALIASTAEGMDLIETELACAGADKVVVATTDAPIVPLWAAVGGAWAGLLDLLRPRVVLFGADAPSAAELAPRTGARIGARLLLRAQSQGLDDVELRDRDGGYVRAQDSGAAVALIGRADPAPRGDDDIDLMVIAMPGTQDPRIELAGSRPADVEHNVGAVVALADDAANQPAVVANATRLAELLGAEVVGSAKAANAGAIAPGAVVERRSAIAPELCVAVGAAQFDVAGATTVITIGGQPGRLVDVDLPGAFDTGLAALVAKLEAT